MDKRIFSCGVFADLKNTFDTVHHAVLLNKLYHDGVTPDWLLSYLK